MDHGRLRGSYRPGTSPDAIDLGNEPPLSVDGEMGADINRRRVSVQWLSGTILTGLCGAALMAGAVYAALDGEAHFAAAPEHMEALLRPALGPNDRSFRKTDKLAPVGDPNALRHVIRVSTTSRMGDHQVVRVRPFIDVAGNLALSTSELSANVPPFNPQRMLADASGAPADGDAPDAAPDAEVAFVTRDLMSVMSRIKIASTLPMEDVIASVREAASWTGNASERYAVTGGYPQEATPDPYYGFAHIVPENITLLPKTASQTTGGNSWNERTVTFKKGDTLTSVLHDLGATPDETYAIARVLGSKGRDGAIKEGQRIKVLLAQTGGRFQPVRVIVMGDSGAEAVAALSDMGRYVAVDVQSADTRVAEEEEPEDDGSGVRLYQSIYETALRNQVPRPVIDNLVRIYSYDVDFQRKTQPGDSFEVLYAGEEENIGPEGKADVLYASLTVGGETKKFYRFQTLDDGVVDYYDETGKSVKKFLVRKPVNEAIMRSGFGERNHPILGVAKMHTGVDWAAPMGTPIFASGNGEIEKIGWEGGYGKYIKIKHANGYETAYGHMSAFARGMDVGVHVRQGQIIGFVGSTGLSTGAHVHYEILVNGRFVDPMRYKLPHGRSLEGPMLADFERERDRLDAMIATPTRVAQTKGGAGR